MRNEAKTKIERILSLVENLPFFSLDDLLTIEENKNYLKILLSRCEKSGKVFRLKKGTYTTKEYFSSRITPEEINFYYEFLANVLYSPSYLSLEYVLSEHNVLTEFSYNFTSITKNKTKKFKNRFGIFVYHHIKDPLFCGFNLIKKENFFIFKATKTKALFDFLYLRKDILNKKNPLEELRLNLENFDKKDIKEFKTYLKLNSSKKMKEIFKNLLKL